MSLEKKCIICWEEDGDLVKYCSHWHLVHNSCLHYRDKCYGSLCSRTKIYYRFENFDDFYNYWIRYFHDYTEECGRKFKTVPMPWQIEMFNIDKRVFMFFEVKTPELCFEAVKYDYYALRYVPEEMKTEELCRLAFEKNESALIYIPDRYKTPEMCSKAVDCWCNLIKCVPDQLKTPEMCLKAVTKAASLFESIPEGLKTTELCKIAVEKDEYMANYVPENLRTPEMRQLVAKMEEEFEKYQK